MDQTTVQFDARDVAALIGVSPFSSGRTAIMDSWKKSWPYSYSKMIKNNNIDKYLPRINKPWEEFTRLSNDNLEIETILVARDVDFENSLKNLIDYHINNGQSTSQIDSIVRKIYKCRGKLTKSRNGANCESPSYIKWFLFANCLAILLNFNIWFIMFSLFVWQLWWILNSVYRIIQSNKNILENPKFVENYNTQHLSLRMRVGNSANYIHSKIMISSDRIDGFINPSNGSKEIVVFRVRKSRLHDRIYPSEIIELNILMAMTGSSRARFIEMFENVKNIFVVNFSPTITYKFIYPSLIKLGSGMVIENDNLTK